MKSFKAYFKKEILEAARTSKYLVLFIGPVFWALLNPLTLKLLPAILKNYLPVELITMFSTFTRDSAFQSFLGDLFQIGTLFIVLSLMGLFSNEIYAKKLVFPYSRGVNPFGIVFAKYIHYLVAISLFIVVAFLTNYFYITRLFNGGVLTITIVLKSSLLFIFYYWVLLSVLIFFSSIFKRGLIAGIIVLVLAFGMNILNQFETIRAYFPNYLIFKASDILDVFDNSLILTCIVSTSIIILFISLSIRRMNKIDIA